MFYLKRSGVKAIRSSRQTIQVCMPGVSRVWMLPLILVLAQVLKARLTVMSESSVPQLSQKSLTGGWVAALGTMVVKPRAYSASVGSGDPGALSGSVGEVTAEENAPT